MSRSRQPQATPSQPPTPSTNRTSPGEVENMDIMAQAMASMESRPAPVGQDYSQGAQPFPIVSTYPGVPSTAYQGPTGSSSFATIDDAFQRMSLRPKDYVCEFYDQEVVNRKGVFLQYINTNSTGATTAIGVTRIGITDPRKVPLYLSRNVAIIRQHAVAALHTHMKLTLCSAGVLEKLSPDDFSISFSWASLTEAGRQLSPLGKGADLALGYAACEGLVAPIFMSKADPFPSYVVNVFIYLQDATRRSTAVVAKAREDAILKANPDRKVYVKKFPQPVTFDEKTVTNMVGQAAMQAATTAVSEMKRVAPPTFDSQFPPLPTGSAPEWNTSGRTSLPDN